MTPTLRLPSFGLSETTTRVLLWLMLLAAALAWWGKPTQLLADQRSRVDLETLIPVRFGDWTALPHSTSQIVNPQQQEVIERLYTQTLGRIYVDGKGNTVMLSIAYGRRQNDSFALHYPESCYPAQGFEVGRLWKDTLSTPLGNVAVTRLHTRMGSRNEPVTYWATVGDVVVQRGLGTKWQQMRYGVRGQVPDGMIFRVSTVSAQAIQGLELQNSFVHQLLVDLSPSDRRFVAGL